MARTATATGRACVVDGDGAAAAYLWLAVALVLWATLSAVAKLALAGLAPAQFTFLRAFLAGLSLLLVCAATGRLGALRGVLARPWVPIILGLVAFTLSNHLAMASLEYMDAGPNLILASLTPLFVVA